MKKRDLIVRVLCQISLIETLDIAEWDLLIRQARRANLIARLASQIETSGLMGKVPEAPRLHLQSALRMVARQGIAIRREVWMIRAALEQEKLPTILLKGAAYLMAGLPAAHGRVFSDVDIIIPREQLDLVESQLLLNGWKDVLHDPYDQKYYRRWMHEIPPMVHGRRGTSIDVHHSILPETARIKVNSRALLDSIMPVPGEPGVFTLAPVDMLLHSATHLFHEGELGNGLRDLFDLDSLMRHFGASTGFWEALVPRAKVLGLTRPLYYALRFTQRMLDTPIPAHVLQAISIYRPALITDRLMTWCYDFGLRPLHPSTDSRRMRLARLLLYIRSHWMRMPLTMLFYHLGRKALLRPQAEIDLQKPLDQIKKAEA